MKIIGLTGGIASGKSTVSKFLAQLGAEIIDADVIARKVVQPREKAYTEIVNAFGSDILTKDGTIDRKRLAEKVFNDKAKLELINAIVHPEVIAFTKHLLSQAKARGVKVAVVDAPLLIEAKMTSLVEQVWLVTIDEDEQIKRASARDKASYEEIKARIRAQLPLEEKKQFAHVIIDNSGSIEDTYKQVQDLYRVLIAE